MRRFTLFISVVLAAAFLWAGCGSTPSGLRTGDILFVGLPMDYEADTTSMGSAIAESTGGDEINLIHAAIIEVQGDSTWIIDATIKRGVDRYPLDTFLREFTLKDGSYPIFQVKRLADSRDAATYVENAKKYIGQEYDSAFLPANGAMYCTELIYESYLQRDGTPIFHSAPMNFKNSEGEFPPYWINLFAGIGAEIPQGIPGTNPQNMAAETVLVSVEADITAKH